jgi:acyl-CoA synthetase (AMP-forming)/AMP-acid ligase II
VHDAPRTGAAPVVVAAGVDTLPAFMNAAADRLADHEAYVEVETGRRLSFAAWVEAADGVAAHLARSGVQPGDVVAIALPPSIDYAIAYAAVARLGAVAAGINTRLGPREVAAIFERCQPAAVIHDGVPTPDAPVMVGRAELTRTAANGDHPPPVIVGPDDPAVIIWTSGTTGAPKGAWFDHRNLAAAVRTAGVMTAPFDRRISGIPFAHAGYMAKLWEQFAFGVTVVLTPLPWSAEAMLAVLVDERITVGAGVPTQWAKLLALPGVEGADLSALRVCLAATAPAPPELVARVHDVLGCPMVVRYAMTESPSITGTDVDDPPAVQYWTVGRPQEGMVVELVDDDGALVASGAVGRVRVSGPCVMRGYWGDAERTSEVLDGQGRLLSTDLGRFDAAGNLVLVGRASEMYIRGGYNVYPLEVEQVVAEHPLVEAVAVVGAPRPVIGEIGVAFVVPAAAGEPDLASLRAWVHDRLADYKAPDEVRLLDALPLTAMQKVDKEALRRSAAAR